jgi:hypothetical protein
MARGDGLLEGPCRIRCWKREAKMNWPNDLDLVEKSTYFSRPSSSDITFKPNTFHSNFFIKLII